ncbi:hypothetical protein PSECIP111854_02568 [Pseudoalteromonas sp. CIP111854]|uniref:HTH LytTR-type domain-containing protein n=1 Tax=Pseudoalteromonas holothuriae TaxID=2963714 RepID=A0A9W4VRX7_9GAMM|nr:hypothetical protein PSECIP111854_02568 [Pseudoalteromonas sp. CIP111854]
MYGFNAQIQKPKQRLKYQCLLSTIIWTVIILVLSCISWVHDLIVAEHDRIDDPIWWSLQEWCLWYLLTPITFALLDKLQQLNLVNRKGYFTTLLPMYCTAMVYQAIFDVFVYQDPILGTLVYFAPSHLLILYISTLLWHKLWKTPEKVSSHPAMLLVDQGKHKTLLPMHDIVSLSAASNYVEIHSPSNTYIKRATLKDLMQKLPPNLYIQCHRSHIINLSCIKHIERKPSGSGLIHLNNGHVVPLSKRYYSDVRSLCAG